MKNRFDSLLNRVESSTINSMTDKEISSLTGGATAVIAGSQTSGTGSASTLCCDGTCVCRCIPPIIKESE